MTRSRLFAALVVILAASSVTAAPPPRLKVSENRRFLVTEDGRPFFWLGDTAWELFHRLNREEADRYLAEPRREGLHGHSGGRARRARRAERPEPVRTSAARRQRPDPAGRQGRPGQRLLGSRRLHRREGQRPRAGDRHVLPTWGDKWNKKWGVGPEIFTPAERRGLRRVARAPLPRRRPSSGSSAATGRSRRTTQRRSSRDGARPAPGRRRHAPVHFASGGRPGLRAVLPRRRVARLQHAAERARRRVHRPLRQRRARTTTDARRSPCSTASRSTRTTRCRSTPAKLRPLDARATCGGRLLGSLLRRVRPHLRPSLGLADVDAAARTPDQQPADAVVRGDRPARRGADAARPRAPRVAPVPHARPGRLDHRQRPRADVGAGRGPLPVRGDARRRRQLRDGLRAGGAIVLGAHGRDQRGARPGLVVQPSGRQARRRSA